MSGKDLQNHSFGGNLTIFQIVTQDEHNMKNVSNVLRMEDSKASLLRELRRYGIRYNPNEIIRIDRKTDGKIVFLEKGKGKDESRRPSGLRHIIEEHGQDFENKGITKDEIPDIIMEAVTKGKVVRTTGRNRPVYEICHKAIIYHIAVSVGSNGYIVGANPCSI